MTIETLEKANAILKEIKMLENAQKSFGYTYENEEGELVYMDLHPRLMIEHIDDNDCDDSRILTPIPIDLNLDLIEILTFDILQKKQKLQKELESL